MHAPFRAEIDVARYLRHVPTAGKHCPGLPGS